MKILEGKNKENENTVKFYEYFHTKTELAIIMELCNDNLNNLLFKRKKPFKYEEVYEILKQLNNSFKILNNYKLIHSKLYLKNILIKYENKEKSKFTIKLKPSPTYTNGLKFKLQYDKYYYFIAPEILIGNGYNEKCDLWSLGIMIYHLIFGEIPYDGKDRNSLLQEITKKGSKIRKTENSDLNDLISKLLMQNPNKRITWEEYFNHPFFTNKII